MSDTNLNLSITSTDAGAQAAIKALQGTVRGLERSLQQLGSMAASASGVAAASINKETAAIREQINALQEQIALKKASSSAGIAAAQQEAAYINRNIDLSVQKARQQLQLRNAVARAEQQAAMDSARYEADAINASMALREQRTRQAIAANNARVAAERTAEDKAAAAAATNARAEAGYINTNSNLSFAAMRREADEENANFDRRARFAARQAAQQAEGGLLSNLGRPQMIRHGVAEIDSLMRGQRGQAMASLGAAMRDAGLGAAKLTTSMVGLVALMGSAALLRGAESMGKWATETRAAASAAGMGLADYSQLQGALTLMGLKADEADTTLRRLAINLSTALANPASKAAEAFHNLGISQEMLEKNGTNTAGALNLLANAFIHTNDSANKSANMNEILGRGYEKLIPILQRGQVGLEEYKNKAQELGTTLDEATATALERAGRAVEELGKAVIGGGVQAFAAWSPVIVDTAGALEKLWFVMSKIIGGIGTVVSFIEKVATFDPVEDWAKNAMRPQASPGSADTMRDRMASGSGAGKVDVPPLIAAGGQSTVMDSIRNQMAVAGASASGKGDKIAEQRAEIATLQQLMATEVLTDKQREQLSTELANKTTALNNEMASAGGKAAKQSYTDFASAEALKVASAEGSSTKIKAIYDEWINAAIAKYHQLGSVVDELRKKELEAVNAAKRGEIKAAVSSDEQQSTLDRLNKQLAMYQGGSLGRPTRASGPQADLADAAQDRSDAQAIAAKSQTEIAALKAAGATAQETLGIEINAKQQEVALYERAAEASQEAANKIMAPWIKLFDNIGSQFESLSSTILNSVISPQVTLLKQGLTTIKIKDQNSEISNALRKMLLDGIDKAASSVETALGQVLANALSGGKSNSIGELLTKTLSGALSSVLPSLSGAAGAAQGAIHTEPIAEPIVAAIQRSGIEDTTTQASSATNIISSTTQSSSLLGGIIQAGNALIAGAIALNTANPEIFGFKAERGAVIPSFAAGGLVGGGSLSILHPKEMVLPAHISEGIQRMFSGTGHGNVNSASLHYAPTINTGSRGRNGTGLTRSEFSQMLSLNSGAMLGQARAMMSAGWRPG